MTTGTDVTTIRLPHTGLHVPDASLTVTGYKELRTSCEVAYTAKLRKNNKIVGLVENDGHGGETRFVAADWRTFGDKQLAEHAGLSHTEDGGPVSVEHLLDDLVEEAYWARKVTKAAAARPKPHMVLRLMDASISGFPPIAHDDWGCAVPTSKQFWQGLAVKIMESANRPGENQWWQGFHDGRWHDVTARPADVSPDLCW